ncbi:MAG: HisA/HisF-related TIM barrel protein [Candidatus Bathyarchaeia archaeon]|jgi:phosphoribosylformimino-5-aminoimidazole carboxamide ribotide isomerase
MKVIPVIDVLNGIAVHGIRGERKHYLPLKSGLTNSTNPIEIASTFEQLGFGSLYIADLDAIMGKSANLDIYKQITKKTCLELMVDAGTTDRTKAEQVLGSGAKIVIGSESLSSLDFVKQAITDYGTQKVVVSIDQKNGKLLTHAEDLALLDACSVAQKLANLGVRQIILLDLDRVGTEHGINSDVLRCVLDNSAVDVFVGGGIHGLSELEQLRSLGVSGVLVATVLHNGKVTVDELRNSGFL